MKTFKITNRFIRTIKALRGEGGMTLVEVMTSMVIFLIVSAGMAGTALVGIRTTADAQMATIGKSVAQEQIESMKGHDFYVPYSVGEGGTTADIDLLDTYYPNTDTGSYVDDRGWEGWYTDSTSDAYYTVVSPPNARGMVMTIETRFIDDQGYVIRPSALYDSDINGWDYPPTNLVEITVSVDWVSRGDTENFTLVSLISATDQSGGVFSLPDDDAPAEEEEEAEV